MFFSKWFDGSKEEPLFSKANQELKDFEDIISSMVIHGEERAVLKNMIFLLINTYLNGEKKDFLRDADGRGCLDTLAAPLVLGEQGGTYVAAYDRGMEEKRGKYKAFARYFGKDRTPFGFDVFTGMVLLYTRDIEDREERTHRLIDAAEQALGDWRSFYYSFCFGLFMAAYGRDAAYSITPLKAACRQIADLLHELERQ